MPQTLRDWINWIKAEFKWRILGQRYHVFYSEEVEQQLAELPQEAQDAIKKRLEELAKNPYSGTKIYDDYEYEKTEES